MSDRIRRRPTLADALLAGAFVIAGMVEIVSRHPGSALEVALALPGVLLLGCIALRRTRPLLALTVFATGAAAGTLIQLVSAPAAPGSGDATVPIFALLLLSYSLGAHGSNRELALGAPLPVVLVTGIDLASPSRFSLPAALLFFSVFVVGAPVLAGRLVRLRASLVSRLRAQEHRLKEEQRAQADAALAGERVLMSDRLHRTLLTGLRSLAERAGAIEQAAGQGRPEAIASLEAEARALLSETRTVVVSLASRGEPPAGAAVSDRIMTPAHRGDATAVALDRSGMAWMVVAVAGLAVGLMFETRTEPRLHTAPGIALLACLAVAAPLLRITTEPALAVTGTWAAAALFSVAVAPMSAMFTGIALVFLPPFAVACFAPRQEALLALGVCWLGETAVFGVGSLGADGALSLGAWLAGRGLREATRLAGELRANNLRLAEQQQAQLRAAVLEQRTRVASEVHDSIGHALTVRVLHAGAARRRWSRDHSGAREALRTIRRVAEVALDELQLPADGSRGLGLRSLDELVTTAAEAGLKIDFQRNDAIASLPPDADLAAYRLVQEALTNVIKHAPGSAARLTLRRLQSHLELSVRNGPGQGRELVGTVGAGHGLIGMRQRVEACGGSLEWGSDPRGGFSVCARFPLEASK